MYCNRPSRMIFVLARRCRCGPRRPWNRAPTRWSPACPDGSVAVSLTPLLRAVVVGAVTVDVRADRLVDRVARVRAEDDSAAKTLPEVDVRARRERVHVVAIAAAVVEPRVAVDDDRARRRSSVRTCSSRGRTSGCEYRFSSPISSELNVGVERVAEFLVCSWLNWTNVGAARRGGHQFAVRVEHVHAEPRDPARRRIDRSLVDVDHGRCCHARDCRRSRPRPPCCCTSSRFTPTLNAQVYAIRRSPSTIGPVVVLLTTPPASTCAALDSRIRAARRADDRLAGRLAGHRVEAGRRVRRRPASPGTCP